MFEWEGKEARELEGTNSSSVQVKNYNGAIHHKRLPIRHANPRVYAVFYYSLALRIYRGNTIM